MCGLHIVTFQRVWKGECIERGIELLHREESGQTLAQASEQS